MKICSVCKTNPVKIKGASTCSLKCATELNFDDYSQVRKRIDAEKSKATAYRNKKIPGEWMKTVPGAKV